MALTVALSVGFAAMPESVLGTACLALVVFWWALAAADGVPAGAIPAALLLLAAHVASVLLSYGPPALPIGTAAAAPVAAPRRASSRSPPRWSGCWRVVVDEQPEPPGIWIAGLACAVVVCVVAAVAVTHARGRRVTADPEEYVELVLSVVEQVPRGRVTSYGAIAGVGRRRSAAGRRGDVAARRTGAVVAGGPRRRVAAAEPRGRRPAALPRRGHAAAALRRGRHGGGLLGAGAARSPERVEEGCGNRGASVASCG